MNLLQGDVTAFVAGFIGFALTAWASMLAIGLLFEVQTQRAQRTVEDGLAKSGLIGLVVIALLGGLGIVLLNVPAPIVKLIALVMLGALLTLGAMGAAGMSRMLARRIMSQDDSLALYPATSRAAWLLVGAAMFPLVGWLFFGPVLWAIAVGAGWTAAVRRKVGRVSSELVR
ncbi:MAG: hypothetical protein SFX74_06840 [Fimbriimonadaceae bacterium]|nr:hypothetical protein [Fimbriimonadaceae bacterium]